MLYGTMNVVLDTAVKECDLSTWRQDNTRNRFLVYGMDAYIGLIEYLIPMPL